MQIILPIKVDAAQMTFGQVLDDLAQAEKELNENNQAINNKQGQVKADNATIQRLKQEIESMSQETVVLQQEIAELKSDSLKKQHHSYQL